MWRIVRHIRGSDDDVRHRELQQRFDRLTEQYAELLRRLARLEELILNGEFKKDHRPPMGGYRKPENFEGEK